MLNHRISSTTVIIRSLSLSKGAAHKLNHRHHSLPELVEGSISQARSMSHQEPAC